MAPQGAMISVLLEHLLRGVISYRKDKANIFINLPGPKVAFKLERIFGLAKLARTIGIVWDGSLADPMNRAANRLGIQQHGGHPAMCGRSHDFKRALQFNILWIIEEFNHECLPICAAQSGALGCAPVSCADAVAAQAMEYRLQRVTWPECG